MSAPLVFALEGKKAPTVIGKPNTTMMDAIIAEYVHPACGPLTS